MSENGRIARFVRAARTLLLMQLLAALLAVALAIWAVTAVWELAAERDRLRAQVDAMQSSRAPVEETPLADNPVLNEVRPPAMLPIAVPVWQAPPDVNMIVPEPSAIPPDINQATEPAPETPPAGQDCTGADAGQPRCRPDRWNRPIPQRPVPRPQPDPQQPPAETPSRPD